MVLKLGSVAEPPKVTLAHRHIHKLMLTTALGFLIIIQMKS